MTSDAEQARRHRHRNVFMPVYWSSRQAWVEMQEQETALYPEEMAAFTLANPPPLFKSYLIATRGQPR